MKKAKKMLLAASALALVSFGFIGCGEEDDENEMIVGSNNDYSIAYTNGTAVVSRGYQPTTFKHQGAVMEFKFTNATATSGAGVLGFIWELDDDETSTGAKQFFVLGVRQDDGVPSYYVSHFKNVTNINAANFGTDLPNPAVEKLVSPAVSNKGDATNANFNKIDTKSWADDNGAVTVYADIAPVKGGYEVWFYRTEKAAKSHDTGNAIKKIPVGSDLVGTDTEPPQKYLAVYANVYGNKTLTGSWKFVDTYKAAEIAEAE